MKLHCKRFIIRRSWDRGPPPLLDNQALTDFRKCFFYTRENYAKTIAVQFALDILWRISPKIVRWLVSLNITPFQNLDKTHSLVSPDKL